MTGGRVVVLGATGRNFGAGMSGGIAYVLDEGADGSAGDFPARCNRDMVALERMEPGEADEVKAMIQRHVAATGSERGRAVLARWDALSPQFVKVMPKDYKRMLQAIQDVKRTGLSGEAAIMAAFELNKSDVARVSGELEDGRMSRPTGFMEYPRELGGDRLPGIRTLDYLEMHLELPEEKLRTQAARCMSCGIPFCHTGTLLGGMASGCPINNLIPEWNSLVYRGLWQEALKRLLRTNNFPEFTGRVCPAPCEGSCTLSLHEEAVTVKQIEHAIIERGFAEGWITPQPPAERTGKRVAVVGSGPAGLACADQLNKAGHLVTVFERADRIGGLLMYGIPNMKLDKDVVQRRIDLMTAEGIKFVTRTEVGKDLPAAQLMEAFDASVLCGGATKPRDLPVEGRDLKGIHFAVDFLRADTRSLLGADLGADEWISARHKPVV